MKNIVKKIPRLATYIQAGALLCCEVTWRANQPVGRFRSSRISYKKMRSECRLRMMRGICVREKGKEAVLGIESGTESSEQMEQSFYEGMGRQKYWKRSWPFSVGRLCGLKIGGGVLVRPEAGLRRDLRCRRKNVDRRSESEKK